MPRHDTGLRARQRSSIVVAADRSSCSDSRRGMIVFLFFEWRSFWQPHPIDRGRGPESWRRVRIPIHRPSIVASASRSSSAHAIGSAGGMRPCRLVCGPESPARETRARGGSCVPAAGDRAPDDPAAARTLGNGIGPRHHGALPLSRRIRDRRKPNRCPRWDSMLQGVFGR